MSYLFAHAEIIYLNVDGEPRLKVIERVNIKGLETDDERIEKITLACPEPMRNRITSINAIFNNRSKG